MLNPTPHTSHFELVARISKAIGLDGQLVVHELVDLPVLSPGLDVWVVPPALTGARHTNITEVQEPSGKRGLVLSLADVKDRTQASELAGRYLLAQVGGFPSPRGAERRGNPESSEAEESFPSTSSPVPESPHPHGLVAPMSLEPTRCVDTVYGNLGELVQIKQGPAYDLWVVEGPYGRLEIPAVDAYLAEERPGQIALNLPRGFIEITTGMNPLENAQ